MAATTLTIQEHVPLRDKTTFRVGGPARFFCEVGSEAQLTEAILWAKAQNSGAGVPIFILGSGSNILISDEGFSGLVISMKISGITFDGLTATAGAGENWDDFVGQCVARDLTGLENLSGIPGTVGAAPVQNIGAYGVEVGQCVKSVRVYDVAENSWKTFSAAECGFEYRDSLFKHEKNKSGEARYVITSVIFNLKKWTGDRATLSLDYKDLQNLDLKNPSEIRTAVLSIRAKKLPDVREIGTAGSFFKNPIIPTALYADLQKKYPDMPSFPVAQAGMVKVPLAWILDRVCGFKGVSRGVVGTYKNQALVIVNNFKGANGAGGDGTTATATDIKKLAEEMTASVREKTTIEIEPEVQFI